MLFTTSALSHIFPEIRIDAVRLLDVLLGIIPEVVIDGWPGVSSSGSRSADNEQAESSLREGTLYGRSVLGGYLALLDLKGKPGGMPFDLPMTIITLIRSVPREGPCRFHVQSYAICKRKHLP